MTDNPRTEPHTLEELREAVEQKLFVQFWALVLGPPIFVLKVLGSVWLLHWFGWLP